MSRRKRPGWGSQKPFLAQTDSGDAAWSRVARTSTRPRNSPEELLRPPPVPSTHAVGAGLTAEMCAAQRMTAQHARRDWALGSSPTRAWASWQGASCGGRLLPLGVQSGESRGGEGCELGGALGDAWFRGPRVAVKRGQEARVGRAGVRSEQESERRARTGPVSAFLRH